MRGGVTRKIETANKPRNGWAAVSATVTVLSAIASAGCTPPTLDSPIPDERPQLILEFADPSQAGRDPEGLGAPGDFENIDGTILLADAAAPASLALASWPPAPGRLSRIDVDLKRKHRLFGMRRFALRGTAADDRSAVTLVYEHLRREGVLAPRVEWVRVRSKDFEWGAATAEEIVAKELLESQQRREGATFSFHAKELPTARMDVDGRKKVRKTPQLNAERKTAEGLLQGFLIGELEVREVFDVALMARYLSIAEFWGAQALVRPENLHFYFNPVSQRIEPIGSMGDHHFAPDLAEATPLDRPWPQQLLADRELRAALERERRRIIDTFSAGSPPVWLRRAAASAGGEGRAAAAILETFDGWVERGGRLAAARMNESVPEFVRPESRRDGEPSALRPAPGVAARDRNPIPAVGLAEVLQRHAFLEWLEPRRTLRAKPGIWAVNDSLVVPEGIGLEVEAGTTLRFAADAFLLASGPLRFHGTAAMPVVLEGQTLNGSKPGWQGLVVLESDDPHLWEHVVVQDTTGVSNDGWRLTAGVTIRASQIRIENSVFRRNRTEDALNLIRSRFELRDVSIFDASSDALDCDHGDGSITGGVIRGIQGDGIDVSGSNVRVDGVLLEEIRDKALSVGERSHLEARNLRIRRVGTAVAGKDGSDVVFEDSRVSDVTHVAIMAYTKKNEYGPAQVRARNIQLLRVGQRAVAQSGNIVAIDGVEEPTEAVDVEALYERGYMKK